MTQEERLAYLFEFLLRENPSLDVLSVAQEPQDPRRLLRTLMNLRLPAPIGDDFLRVQDDYLQAELASKGVTRIEDLTPVEEGLYLWRGDITTLAADAIVNAANSGLLGCFVPCHGCIDNAIHSFSGVQLRLDCAALMQAQGAAEPTGTAKLTRAYNLPSRYILHTVGPIVGSALTPEDERLLASCYRACLDLATQTGLHSLAFCCISTGEFHFPNRRAAEIAIDTVRRHPSYAKNNIKVIFNVYQEIDHAIYRALLGADPADPN